MSENNNHWTNQVEVFKHYELNALKKVLNEFYRDRFVIATQNFQYKDGDLMVYDAIVYFKVPPKEK